MNKVRKLAKIILIILLVIGALMVVVTMTGVYDPDNTIIGDNLNASGYGKGGFHEKEFDTIEEAVQAVNTEKKRNNNEMTLLYQATTEKLEKVFLLGNGRVYGYEFVINNNGTYSYIGCKKTNFLKAGQEKKYTWKKTALAELSDSTSKGYKKFVNPKETYGVLPAWGVSDTEEVKNMTVDGQGVDHVIEFTLDGATYYLWVIDDLQTENNAVDVVIDVK